MDDKSKLASLEKAVAEIHSYVTAVKNATFQGKYLEESAKLLKFLQDNFKTLQDQYRELSKNIANTAASEKAKDITAEASEE